MAENKKSFIAYVDWNFIFKKLSDEEAGKLAKMLFSYVSDENPSAPDRITELIFEPIKLSLKRDLIKYENTKEKRVNSGRLGGIRSGEVRSKPTTNETNEANASKTKQVQANEAVSDSVSVTVSDSVTESKKENHFTPPDLSNSNLFRKPNIPTKDQVLQSFMGFGGTKEMSDAFWNECEATEWFYKGSPMMNFRNRVPSYVTNWKKNESGRKIIPTNGNIKQSEIDLIKNKLKYGNKFAG